MPPIIMEENENVGENGETAAEIRQLNGHFNPGEEAAAEVPA